jgi:hypothetical protein
MGKIRTMARDIHGATILDFGYMRKAGLRSFGLGSNEWMIPRAFQYLIRFFYFGHITQLITYIQFTPCSYRSMAATPKPPSCDGYRIHRTENISSSSHLQTTPQEAATSFLAIQPDSFDVLMTGLAARCFRDWASLS